ncbi:MAG: hypothetical protein AAF495_03650 [Pseudomonadota bacterium]
MAQDRLTSQLVEVAQIVGDLGLNINRAQKALNKDYLDNIQSLIKIIKDMPIDDAAGEDDKTDTFMAILQALSPPRYQYTETVLDFSADFAESRERMIAGSAGVAFKFVTVNAAMTLGYGHDYRASARITTTIHARQDPSMANKLLERSAEISNSTVELPTPAAIDAKMYDTLGSIWATLNGKPASEVPTAGEDGGGGAGGSS